MCAKGIVFPSAIRVLVLKRALNCPYTSSYFSVNVCVATAPGDAATVV